MDDTQATKDEIVSVAGAVAPFPTENAYKLITTVRKAYKVSEISQEVSTRGLISWGTSYYVLQRHGVKPTEALAGAFHLAIEAKYYGQERTFIRNAFNAVFGLEPTIPHFVTEEDEHPLVGLVAPFMRLGIPLWLHGPKGCGKSYMVAQIAERQNKTMLRVQITNASVPQELLGDHAANSGSTYFEYGPLPLAMKNGWVLNIDEISSGPPDVQFVLHAVLEGNPLVLTANRGETVHAAPGFGIVFTDNSVGLGEATDYVGTKTTNEAFRDRPLFVAVDYMPAKREKNIVELELTRFRNNHTITVDLDSVEAQEIKVRVTATVPKIDFDAVKKAAQVVV